MTRDEIVAIIKQRLGNYNNATIDAHIITEMKLNQDVMEQEAVLPWFLVLNVSVTGDASGAAFLVGDRSGTEVAFLAEYEQVPLISAVGANSGSFMGKDEVEAIYNGERLGVVTITDLGNPSKYAKATGLGPNAWFRVYPAPTDTWVLSGHVYCADVPLNTDITNLWLTYAPDLVIAKVGLIIASFYTVLEKFVAPMEKQIQIATLRLAKLNALKTEENVRRLMGDS